MDEKKIKVLLIEDNRGDARLIEEMLTEGADSPFTLECAGRLSEGLECLDKAGFGVVLLDLGLPDSCGLETFVKINAQAPRVPIVVLSGLSDESLAVDAVQRGAQDYLVKGHIDSDSLRRSLRYAVERKRIQEALRIKDRVIESSINPIAITDLQGKLTYVNQSFLGVLGYGSIEEIVGRPIEEFWYRFAEALWITETVLRQSFAGIVGYDAKMLELFDTIRQVAEVDVPVLIHGESGTGKELVAIAIHSEGPLADKPFVPVDCEALPEGVVESELFGHVKGAFAGAVCDRKGCFEMANGGTVFLDEVGALPGALQVKLLRLLQRGVFQRVGGKETMKVDVRLISATNKNLAEEVTAGRFREDLFYKLCVVPIHLPPLRERRNDIPLLADYFLKKALAETGRENVILSAEAVDAMMDYDWPGNVRELENVLQHALMKCKDDQLLSEHFPLDILKTSALRQPSLKRQRKRKLDAETVWRTLEEAGGDKLETAQRLGVSLAGLHRFIQESKNVSKAGAR